jgi:LysM repeat protein
LFNCENPAKHPMKKLKLPLSIIALFVSAILSAQPADVIKTYIETYKDLAIEEMKRTGVPASITLAQGIHETFAGQSVLVKKSNNHFGIKCKSDWKGESVSHDDDARGECFRKYSTAAESYRDHSDFLKNRSHYASLFTLDPTDYEAWAYGLKKAGYATNPKYPQVLIKLIKEYNLQDYTLIAMDLKKADDAMWVKKGTIAIMEGDENGPPPPPLVYDEPVTAKVTKSYPSGVFKINETNVVFVTKGTSYLAIAEQHGVQLNRLFEFNDISSATDVAQADQLVFLQRKKRTGANEFYIVVAGETLYDIAQEEGIRLESLLAYNHLKAGMQPEAGEKLYLRSQAPSLPKLKNLKQAISAIFDKEKEVEEYIVHTVQPKETLYSITKKYSVSKEDVLKWNNLDSSDLNIGQQLRINTKTNAD